MKKKSSLIIAMAFVVVAALAVFFACKSKTSYE